MSRKKHNRRALRSRGGLPKRSTTSAEWTPQPGNLVTGKDWPFGNGIVTRVWSCGHVSVRVSHTRIPEICWAHELELVREDLFLTVPLSDKYSRIFGAKGGAYHYTEGEFGGAPTRLAR